MRETREIRMVVVKRRAGIPEDSARRGHFHGRDNVLSSPRRREERLEVTQEARPVDASPHGHSGSQELQPRVDGTCLERDATCDG